MKSERPFLGIRSPWTLFLWMAALGLLVGLTQLGQIAEDSLRVARNSTHKHKASGDIVFIGIDDKSLRDVGTWPWPRSVDAQLADRATEAGAKRIAFDINFAYPAADPAEDQALAEAIARSGKVFLAARARAANGEPADRQGASPMFPGVPRAVISVQYNFQNAVWHLPFNLDLNGKSIPSMSSVLSGITGPANQLYPIDYSIDIKSIPSFSATDLLHGRLGPDVLRGKTVVIGTASDAIGDQYFLPGYGREAGALIQILGAETLKAGNPVNWGWFPMYLAALLLGALALLNRRNWVRLSILSLSAAGMMTLPLFFESRLIFVDIMPGLFVIAGIAGGLAWRRIRARGLTNSVSGLPNLDALYAFRPGRKQAIVAAKLLNFEEALATLPSDREKMLVDQVVARFKVGDPERVIYQGDGGIFAWFADAREPFGNHLEALYTLFRNPARVGNLSVDLSVSFGVEIGSNRSPASRLASAFVAADEAARQGLKWRYHDPDTLEDASWRLSMLSQLDEAIDKGEVWIAYQPKLNLADRRIVGAEALARWTHPVKGPIAATEFVLAAEQHNRIGKLTDFVLAKAVEKAAQINREGRGEFEMAVNMSASLMSDRQFPMRVEALLVEHGLAPSNLVLELTETAALASNGEGLEIINRLCALGVRISIDDYGTGMSTLEYLRRVPADEIKIDQSFVRGITDNRSDRLMVQSTIELAHSLGRRVVAEGAEVHEIVELLGEMGCDIAQGYAIGRPMSFESLNRRLVADRKRHVA